MVTIEVTERVAGQIARMRDYKELNEMKSLICDAYKSATNYLEENNYKAEFAMPLWAVRELSELISDLAMTEEVKID